MSAPFLSQKTQPKRTVAVFTLAPWVAQKTNSITPIFVLMSKLVKLQVGQIASWSNTLELFSDHLPGWVYSQGDLDMDGRMAIWS
jgi:hypothetical protein